MRYVKDWRHAKETLMKEWTEAVHVMLKHQLRWSDREFRFYSGSEQVNEYMAAHCRRMIEEFDRRDGFSMEAKMLAMEFYVKTRIAERAS